MTLEYAILGLLSWRPFAGYDLKKVFSASAVFYWSGNNNQIYRTLIQLHEDGLVSNEVHYQENLPPKKVYSITPKGLEALRAWLASTPEAPELRNTFLVQLAWADLLGPAELDDLLGRYAEEVRLQLRMQQERLRRGDPLPQRTRREAYLWAMINENVLASYQTELDWIERLRRGLEHIPTGE